MKVLSKFHSVTWRKVWWSYSRFKKSLKKNLNVDDNWKCNCYISPLATFIAGETKKNKKTKMLYVWHMTLFGCQWTSNPRFLNLKDLIAHMQVISNNFKPKFFNFENKCGRDYSHKRYTFIMYDLWPFLATAWTTKFWNSKTIFHI